MKQHHLPNENYCISERTSVQPYYGMINHHYYTLTSLSACMQITTKGICPNRIY